MSILSAREYLKAGQLETAIQVAETIAEKEGKDLFLADIAYEYATAGKCDRALQIIENIECERKNNVLTVVVKNYVENEDFERLKQIVEMIKNPDDDDDDWKWEGLRDIAYGYAKSGKFDKAFEFAENFDRDSFKKNEALWAIAYRYAEIGQFELIIKMAPPFLVSGGDPLGAIAELMVAQDLECDRIIEITKTLEYESEQRSLLCSILYEYENREHSLEKIQNLARSVTDESIKYEALKHLAKNFLETKEYDRVLQIGKSIGLEQVRVTSWGFIIPPDSSS